MTSHAMTQNLKVDKQHIIMQVSGGIFTGATYEASRKREHLELAPIMGLIDHQHTTWANQNGG
jgi:hypothetical protein